MKRVSGGSRRIGGSGMRGISRSSMGSRSSSLGRSLSNLSSRRGMSLLNSNTHLNRHHSHMYRRHYGNSVIPIEMRVITYIVFGIIVLIILFT